MVSLKKFKMICYTALLLLLCSVRCDSTSQSMRQNGSDLHPLETATTECWPWAHFVQEDSTCECGRDLNGIVDCNNGTKETFVLECYCMYDNPSENITIVGACIYSCVVSYEESFTGISYSIAKNNSYCLYMNRTGQMCGSCREGFAPPVYSYSLACVECSDYKYNWLKYLAVAYLPLTVFYFIVIFFRINISSPSMLVYVLVSQLIGMPPVMEHLANDFKSTGTLQAAYTIPLVVLYGIWNLDFFRSVYPPFCLHPNMTTLQALALDYAIAVYPMCLIAITYILFKLHFHYSAVVWLWTPFRRCFSYFRKEWDLSNSLIGAFCTFLLLSYVKVLFVTFTLLAPSLLHDTNGHLLTKKYLLYDGTVEWFGKEHRPYAIIGVIIFLFFNFLPMLLFFIYPTKCFQRCLNGSKRHDKFQTLHIMMDIFQGFYSTEPKDCRYFSGVYLLVRMIAVMELAVLPPNTHDIAIVLSSQLLISGFLVLVIKPYKKGYFNTFDVVMLLLLSYTGLLYGAGKAVQGLRLKDYGSQCIVVATCVLVYVPPLYGLLLLMHSLIPHKVRKLFRRVARLCQKKQEAVEHVPYRIEHSEEYPPLLPQQTRIQSLRHKT